MFLQETVRTFRSADDRTGRNIPGRFKRDFSCIAQVHWNVRILTLHDAKTTEINAPTSLAAVKLNVNKAFSLTFAPGHHVFEPITESTPGVDATQDRRQVQVSAACILKSVRRNPNAPERIAHASRIA
jgi:hypothetical protein